MKCHFPNVRASSLWLNGYWYENWAHLHMDAHTHIHTYIPHLHVNHYLLWGSSYLKVENECPHQSKGQFGVTVHKWLILYVHQLDLEKSEHAIVRSANPSSSKAFRPVLFPRLRHCLVVDIMQTRRRKVWEILSHAWWCNVMIGRPMGEPCPNKNLTALLHYFKNQNIQKVASIQFVVR